jgi:peptide chain release factor subunit 1
LRNLTSGVPGKIKAGGQSSQRFHRITEGLAKEFFRRVSEAMKELLFDMPKLKGIMIGGPIPTKEEFLETGDLVTKLKEKVISVKDIGYVDEHGLKLLVEASHEDISNQELIKEKAIVSKFFETLGGSSREKGVYGEERVRLALQRGAAGVILMSKSIGKEKIAEYEALAANIGAETHIVSTETQEGEQFLNLTKGVGAILRFSLE